VENLAKELAKDTNLKIRAQSVDATDEKSLAAVMAGFDLVINATGPYDITAVPTVKAAIEHGLDYIDLNVYVDSTRKVMELDSSAQDANVRVLVGFGVTPGLSNFLAKYGADQLDEVDEIHFATGGSRGRGWTPALIEGVWDEVISDPALVYKHGEILEIPACGDREDMILPDVAEPIEVMSVKLPMVVTIPYFIEGIKHVTSKYGHTPPSQWNDVFSKFLEWGLFSSDPIEVKGIKVLPRDFALSFIASSIHENAIGVENIHPYKVGGTQVKVLGKKRGNPARYVYSYQYGAGYSGNTVGICAKAAEMLLRGEISKRGVLAPEALNPEPFINDAIERGTTIYESTERTLEKMRL
jgi:saccharopine dehydrogenase (NAD+, L-lysine-forming)